MAHERRRRRTDRDLDEPVDTTAPARPSRPKAKPAPGGINTIFDAVKNRVKEAKQEYALQKAIKQRVDYDVTLHYSQEFEAKPGVMAEWITFYFISPSVRGRRIHSLVTHPSLSVSWVAVSELPKGLEEDDCLDIGTLAIKPDDLSGFMDRWHISKRAEPELHHLEVLDSFQNYWHLDGDRKTGPGAPRDMLVNWVNQFERNRPWSITTVRSLRKDFIREHCRQLGFDFNDYRIMELPPKPKPDDDLDDVPLRRRRTDREGRDANRGGRGADREGRDANRGGRGADRGGRGADRGGPGADRGGPGADRGGPSADHEGRRRSNPSGRRDEPKTAANSRQDDRLRRHIQERGTQSVPNTNYNDPAIGRERRRREREGPYASDNHPAQTKAPTQPVASKGASDAPTDRSRGPGREPEAQQSKSKPKSNVGGARDQTAVGPAAAATAAAVAAAAVVAAEVAADDESDEPAAEGAPYEEGYEDGEEAEAEEAEVEAEEAYEDDGEAVERGVEDEAGAELEPPVDEDGNPIEGWFTEDGYFVQFLEHEGRLFWGYVDAEGEVIFVKDDEAEEEEAEE